MSSFRKPTRSEPTRELTFARRPLARLYLRFLGAYQVYGGIAGLDAALRGSRAIVSVAPSGLDLIGVGLWVATALLFALLTFAGLALMLSWHGGRATTVMGQVLQSVMVGGTHGGLVFSSGWFAGVLFEEGRRSLMYGWAVNAQIGVSSERSFLALNVVPLVIAASVLLIRRTGLAEQRELSVTSGALRQ